MLIRRYRPLAAFTGAMVLAAALATFWFAIRGERLAETANYLPRIFLQLERSIGYAGFIHHFKNFIIRPEEGEYLEAALDDYRRAIESLDELEAVSDGARDGVDLSDLRRTLSLYRQMLDTAQAASRDGASISEVDALVRISDEEAALDLTALQERIEGIFARRRSELRTWRWGSTAILAALIFAASAGAAYINRLRQRELRLIADVFDKTAIAVAVLDERDRFRFFNSSYLELSPDAAAHVGFGEPYAPALHAWLDDMDPDSLSLDEIAARLERPQAEQSVSIDVPLKDGRVIECLNFPLDFGGRLLVRRDVTEQRREAQAHARELSALVADLERSNRELDDFAYVASHDLKEPLRGIAINASFLAKEELSEKARDRLERISTLSRRMDQLISELLFFSRIGHAGEEQVDVDPVRVVEAIRNQLREFLDEKNGAIEIEGELPLIRAARARVKTVFQCLIVNAIQYSDADRRIARIGFRREVEADGRTLRNVFFVADNGIGIDERNRDRVFRIFTRLNAEASYGAGTGAGLAFARKIVTEAGGEMTFVSRVGEGATFYFSFPLSKPDG